MEAAQTAGTDPTRGGTLRQTVVVQRAEGLPSAHPLGVGVGRFPQLNRLLHRNRIRGQVD